MMFTHDIEGCFDGVCGLQRTAFERVLAGADRYIEDLRQTCHARPPEWLALPERRDDLDDLAPVADRWRAAFDDVVIVGTGGSCIAARTLYALADIGFGPARGIPRLHFLDNVDPVHTAALLQSLDLTATGFIAISQSGATPDTLALTLGVLRALIDALPDHTVNRHLAVITKPADNPLRRLARAWELDRFDHHPEITGRFAPLSPVGMLPAMILGLDAGQVRDGAARILNETLNAGDASDSSPAVGAALTAALYRDHGVRTSVALHYADQLSPFFTWWRQLTAESLGKDGQGLTPVVARGASDQNSQLQLYLDGPADKLFTVVTTPVAGRGPGIDLSLANDPALDFLADKTVGDLMSAAAHGTVEALKERGRPVRYLRVGRIDETQLGGLFMHFQLETVLTARLIGVDPFGQKAADHSHELALRFLAEQGEEDVDEETHPWLRDQV